MSVSPGKGLEMTSLVVTENYCTLGKDEGRLARASGRLFAVNAKREDLADLTTALLGFALDQEDATRKQGVARKAKVVSITKARHVDSRLAVPADDDAPDTCDFRYWRRSLQDGRVWLLVWSSQTRWAIVAIVAPDPTYDRRHPEDVEAVREVLGTTAVCVYYQLVALDSEPRSGAPWDDSEVENALLEGAASCRTNRLAPGQEPAPPGVGSRSAAAAGRSGRI